MKTECHKYAQKSDFEIFELCKDWTEKFVGSNPSKNAFFGYGSKKSSGSIELMAQVMGINDVDIKNEEIDVSLAVSMVIF